MSTVKVYNANPRLINLPTVGRFRPRLLPGTNELDKEYLDKVLAPNSNGQESPTARMFRMPEYGLRILANQIGPDLAPPDNTPHVQNEERAPSPDSLLDFSDEEAHPFIGNEENADKLLAWARESADNELGDRLETIVERMKSLGITPG